MISTPNQSVQPAHTESAVREKRAVALSSVFAGVFLTAMKLVVGLMTGSLGILSEAAHSALDFMAAGVTWLAVRVSGRPADREHPYGHGKVENLSALFETVLLLVTCGWIIYEAIERLFFKQVTVEASVWAFAIMVVSIVVDLSRSRALSRMAQKYNSQALEADALHFSTDIWSSAVVLLGLVGVLLSTLPGLRWLLKADALAALGVAGIVVWVSIQLGRKTIANLLDEVPPGLLDGIVQAVRLPGVLDVGRVRVRRSGPEAFADVTLTVGREALLERAHEVATAAEAAVRQLLPGADVVVHVEPADGASSASHEDAPAVARAVALRMGLAAHNINVEEVLGSRSMELHLEVDDTLSVGAAHDQATAFERALREALPGIGQVVTHIEPTAVSGSTYRAEPKDEAEVLEVLHELAREDSFHCHPHNVTVRRTGGELAISFHCALDADTAITTAHTITEQVEHALRTRLPHLGRVVIHVEPLRDPSRKPTADS
jgi:cation diffusion facilitator family transporter